MLSGSGYVFFIILVAAVLMASNRVRYDLVALIVVAALILGNVLTVSEALSGFGSSVVILVAGLLVVGEMLERTGVARSVGDLILAKGGKDETRLLILLMVSAGILGCVMSSTAVVAILIPVVLRIASETSLDKSRLLLPMSYAALISGMLTLIATTPNLVVSDELVSQGYEALGFFSFFPIGAIILVVTIIYMLAFGRHMLSSRPETGARNSKREPMSTAALWQKYATNDEAFVFTVTGKVHLDRIRDLGGKGIKIIGRRRRDTRRRWQTVVFLDGMELQKDDIILVKGPRQPLLDLDKEKAFQIKSVSVPRPRDWSDVIGLVEVMVHPEATIIGDRVIDALDKTGTDISVWGLIQDGEPRSDFDNVTLKAGDRFLLAGSWDDIDQLAEDNTNFVLLGFPKERKTVPPTHHKYGVSLGILAGMVLLSALDIVPITLAVLLTALAAVLFRTMSADQAYKSISIPTLVLIAGMLPLANALDKTGGTDLIVSGLLDLLGEADPRVLMAALFALTAMLGLVLSNTASAVLVAPISITTAEAIGVSPYPLAITVLIAASAAFSTPVSTPVVTLVVTPGGYSFRDFLKLGIPLTVLVCVLTVLITPFFFPL